jgi:hypothetical protein
MKSAVLFCLLLLPACAFFESSYEPETKRYELTWYCTSPDGCERTQEVAQIDRATKNYTDVTLMSTQDPSFEEEGTILYVDSLPSGCVWIYYLSLFGHELEPSKLCHDVGGWELDLSIPNADPTTSSRWVISGRDVRFL